ncbi:cysteine proteinase inhibitor 8-like [Triticum aestivum]|uniref:cysteine proteinase inhibitor 8-like n=1 Tax=Triticum aestivum TaxID=4565 RepID=UPI001D00C9D4|nr:cysteine proteinase inhibitor 8-like [Triticum aestivum]
MTTTTSQRRQAMATCSHLLLALVVVAAAVDSTAAFDQDHTPFKPIPDLSVPRIQELGRWAVQQHNDQTGDRLTFTRVNGGQFQIVAPALNYLLDIDATNVHGTASTHTALIFVQYWTNTQRLDSFN